MIFWIIVLLVTTAAALLLTWLFLRRVSDNDQQQTSRIARNVQLYQQRLARLGDELEKQFIDVNEYEQQKVELARQLLRDVESLHIAPQHALKRSRWLYLCLVPTPLFALALYAAIGAYPDWQISQQLSELQKSQTIEEYRGRFALVHQAIVERLEQRPDHIEYRMLLANHAMNQQDYNNATMHFGILAELLPEDDEILALYAQAEYLRSGRTLNATVAHYMDKALRINPDNRTVLGLQGVYAIEHGDYAAAVTAWQHLLRVLPEDSDEAAIIRQGVEAAKAKLGDDQAVAELPGIRVSVSLDPALSALSGELNVFVYARAANGPPMPLAARKITVADLPATLHLDDSVAMMPQMKLSDFTDVIVGARVSFSGEPIARNGDLQGESEPLNWREKGAVELLINQEVKR